MNKQIRIFILFSILTIINLPLHAHIITTPHMGYIAQYICEKVQSNPTKKFLIILGLDDTIMEPHNDTGEGSNRWFHKIIAEEISKGTEKKEAFDTCLKLWSDRQESEIIRAVEPDIITLINWLHTNKIPLTVITTRSPCIAESTLDQLNEIRVYYHETKKYHVRRVSFKHTAPLLHQPVVLDNTLSMSGIHFIGNLNKGDMCEAILCNLVEKPDEIFMIDDGKKHLEHVEAAVSKYAIPFTGYHYNYFEALEQLEKNYRAFQDAWFTETAD